MPSGRRESKGLTGLSYNVKLVIQLRNYLIVLHSSLLKLRSHLAVFTSCSYSQVAEERFKLCKKESVNCKAIYLK